MGNKKLVWCCIIGIVLGFFAPLVLPVARQYSLSVGMVAGLGLGYVLDMADEKKSQASGQVNLGKKAAEANRLMEEARAKLNNEVISGETGTEEIDADEVPEMSEEEQAAKLSQAEALLREARERMHQTAEDPDDAEDVPEPTDEEKSAKLSQAEALLREARERMK